MHACMHHIATLFGLDKPVLISSSSNNKAPNEICRLYQSSANSIVSKITTSKKRMVKCLQRSWQFFVYLDDAFTRIAELSPSSDFKFEAFLEA
jgi:hypothetical protein